MSILADYRCLSCLTVSEYTVNQGVPASTLCPVCGHSDMTRLIGAPRLLYSKIAASGTPASDAMTTSIDKWQKGRAQKLRIELRNLERHGTYD